ncbi:hypothetical protein [Enterovirga sp. CN4-39]|uniref:hypothetical protein n=1 Tax=Enterovirga sp. CN4-39 TaxID=3400910 RepID=UPI003C05AEC4
MKLRESSIQSAVIAHWRALGYPDTLVAAIPNARAFGQAGLTKGLPDLMVIGGKVVPVGFIELKAAKGAERPEQAAIRRLCTAHGVPCVLTRGLDEPITILEQWGVVRPRSRSVLPTAEAA